jgi:peptidoglycan/xylan/chitin deacetylase (PgdA/CDA1 family)
MSDVMILCYHAISPTWTSALAVTPEDLEWHLSLLAKRGWQATTFSEALSSPPARRTLAVTFDDAFQSVREHAYPILSALSWPATVFVPTAFASTRQTLAWRGIDHWQQSVFATELLSMDWDDLGALADGGWEIGSHTCTHPHLTTLKDDELRVELGESLQECSTHLGRPCRSIAYPYGDVDARVAQIAGEVGYVAGAALSSSLRGDERLRWPRVGIYGRDTHRRFRAKVSWVTRLVRGSRWWH